jgi:hypothetical protein
MFQEVWIGDSEFVAVRPQPELKPFFDLHHQESELALPYGTEDKVVTLFLREATPVGFEPTISTVTGWHVRPLHHGAIVLLSVEVIYVIAHLESIRGRILCQGKSLLRVAIKRVF